MTEIDGKGSAPISPGERRMYEQDYKRGAEIFKDALESYSKSTNSFQKEEFKDVMDQAMEVLNGSAQGLKRAKLLEKNAKIEEDYALYQKQEGPETQKALKHDIDVAKKLVS